MIQYPHLKYLIECYCYQSWNHEFDSLADLVAYFCSQEMEERVEMTIREIQELMHLEGDRSVGILLDAITSFYSGRASVTVSNESAEEVIETCRKRVEG